MQHSEPIACIPEIVSKSALVLLQNTNERFQGNNRSIFCSLWNPSPVFENHIISNVTEYLHPVPISTQTIFYNFRNKTLCPFHIRNLNSAYKKEEPNQLLLILFQRICFKQYSSRSRFASANRSASTSSQLFGVRYFQYSSLDLS